MILEVKNGGFSYQSSRDVVFEDINIQVSPGQVLCILGPNGVGKTSLLKCISGLLPFSKGTVLCKGRELSTMKRSTVSRTIAHVPQAHYPVFAYSVFDTVLMGRTPYLGFFSFPAEKDEKIARRAIESLGIHHLADKPYTEISGGERQLVLFARVLAQQPEIIVLDEPTSHLDYGNQLRILSIIHKLSRQGTAVIMTSHNPDHAFMVADSVGIMMGRHIACFGAPRDIITEKILRQMYGVEVRLMDNEDFGKICVPELEKNNAFPILESSICRN